MGSGQYAIAESKAVETPSVQTRGPGRFRLWVDGVLEPDRIARLESYPGFAYGKQYENFYLGALSSKTYATGMNLREFLDPHIFVLQIDNAVKMLEINFNPTDEQVAALRRLHEHIARLGNGFTQLGY